MLPIHLKRWLLYPVTALSACPVIGRGQYSIRVNQQWRMCFTWDEGVNDVEIVDYH
jgi:plasmid maintenance system killer protein